MTDASPLYPDPFFIYGVHYQFMRFGVFTDEPMISNTFPVFRKWEPMGLDQDRYSLYGRDKDRIVFRAYPHEKVFFGEGPFSSALAERMWLMRYLPSIHDGDWHSCLALYYDYLAAMDAEQEAVKSSSRPYFLYLDQRSQNGSLLSRRLIYILRSPLAIRYFLRQSGIWQQSIWDRRNSYSVLRENVSAKRYRVEHIDENEISYSINVRIEYVNVRSRPPFRQKWQWHISSLAPVGDTPRKTPAESGETDRETYRPGDPRILRETGSGQFGSYPSFEGDEEEE